MYSRLALIFLFLASIVSCKRDFATAKKETLPVIEPWVGEGKTTVLIDSIHQWEARPDFVFDENEFRYCHSQSVSRLMANLIERDFRYRQIREGALTDEVLKGHDVVVINVPTFIKGGRSVPDRKFPRIRPKEVDALVRYVEQGGGLFVLAEHNNAYDNAENLNPLLSRFGIEVPAAYAIEPGYSKYSFEGSGCLISIWNYDQHPVTRGVRATSWLGGAPLKTEHGVGFLSDKGLVDFGNYITKKPMKHSNRRLDPGEYQGPGIPVVAVAEKGKGRVVVIGDHNVVGVQWLGVADNFKFAMNLFAWLAKRETESPHIADMKPSGVTLGVDLAHSEWNIGVRDREGFHPGFLNFARHPKLFPLGLLDLADPSDVLMFMDPPLEIDAEALAKVDKRLVQGQRVVLLFDPSEPRRGSLDLLKHYLPDLVFRSPSGEIPLEQLQPEGDTAVPRLTGKALPVFSEELGLNGLEIGALVQEEYKGKGRHRRPFKFKNATPYLLDISVSGGKPMVSAATEDDRRITVMQRFPVKNGEIVIMPQAKLWGNETFGTMRDEPFEPAGQGAYDMQMAFMRWLVSKPAVLAHLSGQDQEVDGDPGAEASEAQ